MITNQSDMYEANSQSRVIFKNYNDTSTRDFLNSYRYEPSRNKQFKKWKPEFSNEERFKLKRDREEEYLQNFHPDDRPVLLVQKKHEYKGIENPNVFVDPTRREAYYKVSENTQTLDDITQEIQQLERFIRRNTVVHKPRQTLDDQNLSSIYKVEGKEFLPEGFIELDPLLMIDEYEFEGDVDKKSFDKEQRKLKMLRRKQYEQRKQNKVRDVTIFVMDEQKNKVLMFLDKWITQHKRKMNEAELQYVADNLKVPSDKLSKLQDLYFKKKEIIANKKFNDPNLHQGQSPAYLKGLPTNIKGQFYKNKFDNVDARYMQQNDAYVPTFLNKYNKKPIQKSNSKSKANKQNKSNSRLMDTKELDRTLVETFQEQNQRLHDNYGLDDGKNSNSNLIQDISQIQQKNDQSKNSIPDYEQFLKDKKSMTSLEKQNNNDFNNLQDPFEKMLNNKNNIKVAQGQPNKFDMSQNEQQQAQNFQRKRPSFENDLQRYFDNEIDNILGRINNLDNNKNQQQNQNTQENQNKDQNQSQNKEEEITHKGPTKKYPTQVQKIKIQKLPQRLTVVNHQSDSILKIIHKLKPISIGNEYFYQTIEQTIHNKKNKSAILITKNDQGEQISICDIPRNYIGISYENEVKDITPEYRGDLGKEVIVKNNKGQIVHQQILRPRIDQLHEQDFSKVLDVENFKKPFKLKEDNITTIRLNPVVFNGKQYKQVIEEIVFKKNKDKQINVLTYDEHNEILANERIKPFFQSETYYSMIDVEELENQQKKISLVTKNKKGELLAQYELEISDTDFKDKYLRNQSNENYDDVQIYNLNPVIIGDRILKQEIHIKQDQDLAKVKTFDDYDKQINEQKIDKNLVTSKDYSELNDEDQKIVLETKNQDGKTIAKFQLPEEYNQIQKSQKFDEITEIVDNEGFRRASVAVKTSPQQQFRTYQLRPTLIGNQFYQQTINELINIDDPQQNKAIIITKDEQGNVLNTQDIDADKIAQNYYNQIIDETIDKQGQRKTTIATYNNKQEQIGKFEISENLAQKQIDENYDKIIEEFVIENEDNKKDIDLIKIDKNNDEEIDVQQIHLNQQQLQELEEISNEEYFQKLFDIFGDRRPRRSFEKQENEFQQLRQRGHTYAGIPLDYKEKSALTNTNKNMIDQFVQEVNDIHENYKSQPKEQTNENIEDFIQKNKIEKKESKIQKEPSKKKSVQKQSEKSKEKQISVEQKPRAKTTIAKAQKNAKERVRSKTKNAKQKNPMSFEEMEKKLQELENKQQLPISQENDKKISMIDQKFKPSIISQLYESKYGQNQQLENQNLQEKEYQNKQQSQKDNQEIKEEVKEQEEDIDQQQEVNEQDQIKEQEEFDEQNDSQEQNKEHIEDDKEYKNEEDIDQQKQNDNSDKQEEEQQNLSEEKIEQEEQIKQDQKSQNESNENIINEQEDQKLQQSQKDTNQELIDKESVQDKKDSQQEQKNIEKTQSKKSLKKKLTNKKITSKRNSIQHTKRDDDKKLSSLQDKKKHSSNKNLKNKKKSSVRKKSNKPGKHTELMNDEEQLKKYFDDYIEGNKLEEDEIKQKLSKIMEQNEQKKSSLLNDLQKQNQLSKDEVLDDFYQFCRELESDTKYKRRVFFATMFYYFKDLKRRNKLVNKQLIYQLINISVSFSVSFF